VSATAARETTLEAMERRNAEIEAGIARLNLRIDEGNRLAFEARQEQIRQNPREHVASGGTTGTLGHRVGQLEKRVQDDTRDRDNLVRELHARLPLLEAERRRVAEEKSAGLIRRTK
jgi:hypothetical protein